MIIDVQEDVISVIFYFSEIFKTTSIYVQSNEIHSQA